MQHDPCLSFRFCLSPFLQHSLFASAILPSSISCLKTFKLYTSDYTILPQNLHEFASFTSLGSQLNCTHLRDAGLRVKATTSVPLYPIVTFSWLLSISEVTSLYSIHIFCFCFCFLELWIIIWIPGRQQNTYISIFYTTET